MKSTDPRHEARREAFDEACDELARQASNERSVTMAKATTSTKTPSKAPPTPQVPPPANETRVLPDGTIQRFKDGKLIKTTSPPKGNGHATPKPAAKAKPPTPSTAKPQAPQLPASLQAAVQATGRPTHYLARLGSEDIWEFEAVKPRDPESPVIVRRFIGYDQQGADKRYSAQQADKLWREMLTDRGYTWIDGVTHKLMDEDA